MKNALQNKRGNSYVWLCVVVLVASMLFSVLLLYMSLTAQVGIQKRETQAKLDGYLAAFAAGEYNALKRGADYEQYLAWERLEQGVYPVLGFENDIKVGLDAKLLLSSLSSSFNSSIFFSSSVYS